MFLKHCSVIVEAVFSAFLFCLYCFKMCSTDLYDQNIHTLYQWLVKNRQAGCFQCVQSSSVIYFALQLSCHVSVCIFISFLQADGTDFNLFLQQWQDLSATGVEVKPTCAFTFAFSLSTFPALSGSVMNCFECALCPVFSVLLLLLLSPSCL